MDRFLKIAEKKNSDFKSYCITKEKNFWVIYFFGSLNKIGR
jgi:hypothetical protein